MPLVLSPSYVTPSAPLQITSPDGHLTAKVDTAYDGVLLKVDYSATKTSYPSPFEAVVYRVNPDRTTVRVRSGDPVVGFSGVCYAYDHEAPLGVPVRYYAVPVEYPAQPSGILDRAGWTATASVGAGASLALDASNITNWTSGVGQSNGMYFQVALGPTPRAFDRILLDTSPGSVFDYPAGYSVTTSMDGVTWGTPVATGAGSSQFTTISFASQWARYVRVTLTSASGNWWTIGDFQLSSTNGRTPGTPSDSVVVTIPARSGGHDDPALWLKSLENASLSRQILSTSSGKANFAGHSTATPILDSRFPAVVRGRRQARTMTLEFLTETMDQYDQTQRIADGDLVLLQSSGSRYARRDGFWLIEDATPSRVSELAENAWTQWVFQLTEVDRPPTSGQTLVVPGYSFEDDGQTGDGETPPPYATFADEGAAGAFDNMFPGWASNMDTLQTDWTPITNCTLAWSPTQRRSLPNSLRVQATALGDTRVGYGTSLADKYFNVAPGGDYGFRAWVFITNAINTQLEILWRDNAGATISTTTSGNLAATLNGWTELTYNTTAPALAVRATPRVVFKSQPAGSFNYIDDTQFAVRTLAQLGPYNQYGLTLAWAAI
jgi:hypothetical protein